MQVQILRLASAVNQRFQNWARLLVEDVEAQKDAVQSGNWEKMAQTVEKSARDMRKGAANVKRDPRLYNFARNIVPQNLHELGKQFREHDGNAPHRENKLLGKYKDELKQNIDDLLGI